MKKRDLVTLAMIGISAGLLIGGCQQKGNTQETGRRNTAVREQMSSDMKTFYNSLSPDAQDRFLSLDMRHRKMAMQMGTQGQDPNRAVDLQMRDQMRQEAPNSGNEFPIQGSSDPAGCNISKNPQAMPMQGAMHGCSSCSSPAAPPKTQQLQSGQPMQSSGLHGCSSCGSPNSTPTTQPMQGALHGCSGCAGKNDDSNEQRNKRINPSSFNPRGSGCSAIPEEANQKPVIVNQNGLSSCGAPASNGQMNQNPYINGQGSMNGMMDQNGMNGKAIAPEMRDFYNSLNSQTQRKFQDLDAKHKTLAVQMTQQTCKGSNACKGLGGCESATHQCAGFNSCKGQGGGDAIKDPDRAVDAQYRHQMMQRGVMTQELKNNHGY